MKDITLEELLSAGCHFGHQVNRRNPKADEYIFEARSNVHIINLEKTLEGLVKAGEYMKELSANGGKIVIVGTKRQAKPIVDREIARAQEMGVGNLFSLTSRWIGGTITNTVEVQKNIKRLKKFEEILTSKQDTGYTKRELVLMQKEYDKLMLLYGGIANLEGLPDALYIVGTHHEPTAVKEAYESGIDIVGIVDTNADPSRIAHPIPANDDAVGSIDLITRYLVDAWIEGQKAPKKEEKVEVKKEAKEKVEKAPKEKKTTKKATKEEVK